MNAAAPRLSREQIDTLDPYQFLAAVGKTVIRPGGGRSTEKMLALADINAGSRVLEIGCGVGRTAIDIGRRYGCQITAVDKAPLMVAEATENVARSRLANVTVEQADILSLPFPDGSFDRVLIEAVTMFVDRRRAVKEVLRVTKDGGKVLDQEMIWRRSRSDKAYRTLQDPRMCPGIEFDNADDWKRLYEEAGLTNITMFSGNFTMFYPATFLADEGVGGIFRLLGRSLSRPSYARKMAWLMWKLLPVIPTIGYVVVVGEKA